MNRDGMRIGHITLVNFLLPLFCRLHLLDHSLGPVQPHGRALPVLEEVASAGAVDHARELVRRGVGGGRVEWSGLKWSGMSSCYSGARVGSGETEANTTHPVLARDYGAVREHPSHLRHEPAGDGKVRRPSDVGVGRDEDVAGLDRVCVREVAHDARGSLGDADADRGARAGLSGSGVGGGVEEEGGD